MLHAIMFTNFILLYISEFATFLYSCNNNNNLGAVFRMEEGTEQDGEVDAPENLYLHESQTNIYQRH